MKVFLYDLEFDYSLDDDKLDLGEALEEFYNISDMKGSFYGLIDTESRIIQFAWESQDRWLVDIPNPPDFHNYQKYVDYDECIDMIKRIYELNEVVQFGGMIKVDIAKETLDDKLGIERKPAELNITPIQESTQPQPDNPNKDQPYKNYKGKKLYRRRMESIRRKIISGIFEKKRKGIDFILKKDT